MGAYLAEHAVPTNVVVTGQGERAHGSDKHLAGFLRPLQGSVELPEVAHVKNAPRVLLSTSFLARVLVLTRRCRMRSCWNHRGTRRTFCTARDARRGLVGAGGLSFLGEVVDVGQHQRIFALKTRR
jgi:hypothetical protein